MYSLTVTVNNPDVVANIDLCDCVYDEVASSVEAFSVDAANDGDLFELYLMWELTPPTEEMVTAVDAAVARGLGNKFSDDLAHVKYHAAKIA